MGVSFKVCLHGRRPRRDLSQRWIAGPVLIGKDTLTTGVHSIEHNDAFNTKAKDVCTED